MHSGQHRLIPALLLFSSVFGGFTLAQAETELLPSRIVIGLDGISHGDVKRLQEAGRFEAFYPVSRTISTFPSLSDIAWADIFRTVRPVGYQRFHYSIKGNRIVGGALTDLGGALEYEKKMHVNFDSVTHHSYSYMFAMSAAKKEIKTFIRQFWETRGVSTFYVYMLSSDTLQHTDGPIDQLLEILDKELKKLQSDYTTRTGRKLEVVLLSDHGNNHENKGIRVPIKEYLRNQGFDVTATIRDENDVVFTCAGILSSIAIFSRDSQTEKLVQSLRKLEGVDLITNTELSDPNLVRVRKAGIGEAHILKKDSIEPVYAYRPIEGDPLGYLPVVETLRVAGKMDADGFAHADDWLTATADHEYPAALERIYRGHHVVTLNPARILVSLKDGYENANELVKFMTHFKKRGGTHGALSKKGSNGILMTNFRQTQDVTTDRVAALIGFSDLYDYRRHEKGARFLDSRAIGTDVDTGEPIETPDENLAPQYDTFINLWDPENPTFAKLGLETSYRFVVKHNGFGPFNARIARRDFLGETLPRTAASDEFRVPANLVIEDHLKPGDYIVNVYARRVDRATGQAMGQTKLTTLRFFTDLDGQVVAY